MAYLTFTSPEDSHLPRLGVLIDDYVLDLEVIPDLPTDMLGFIQAGSAALEKVHAKLLSLRGRDLSTYKTETGKQAVWPLADVTLLAPLKDPPTLRDFYAFEQHVATAHANRGRQVPAEWYQFPVFYFSNPHAIYGPNQIVPTPSFTQAMDYELEVACIIGKPGRDISPEQAMDYVFGFIIFNDWSARDVQRREMKVGLGPAKGKDFASSLGPYIVTPQELGDRAANRPGVYDLEMVARINGQEYSHGNWKDLHYSFGEMIARASADVTLSPGDVIGSGTVGTGCLLELTKGQGPWLQKGDLVELEIERLGILSNTVG